MRRVIGMCMVVMLIGFQAHALKSGDFFWADPDDPLLEAAKWEDLAFASEMGRDRDDPDYDPYKALDLYEQFIKERDLTDYQRADVRARMGMICMYGMEERDRERARTYFREALELAGEDILSRELYLARTNFAALVDDPVKKFETLLGIYDWLQRMDEQAIMEAVDRRRQGRRLMMRHFDVETGEQQIVPMEEAWPEAVGEEPHERTARVLRERMTRFLTNRMPEICVQAALQHPEPAAAMERLIERTEGTPIAELARESMDKARMYQEIREESLRIMAEQEDAE